MSETTTAPNFESIALSQGIVSPEQIREAQEIQKKVESAGLKEGLDEILVKKGFITQQQRAAILAILGRGGKAAIPGYEIISKLGQGGMGAVYKARQLSMDRLVAIKVLLPSFAREGDAIDRFTREARTIAKLNHPNIVSGIDAGNANGIFFYAMEFVEGEGLDRALKKRGRMAWRDAARVIRQCAEGLNHAHAHGIVHRDIKPANIMTVRDGTVKILDLGLARLSTGDQFHTQAGQVLGTPAYISPEQARGDQDIDVRSDLYSLGIMFYEMLHGKPPFRGDSVLAVVAQHVNDRVKFVAPPDAHDLPAALLAVGAKMTVRERDRRYQNPQEVIDDLEALAAGRPLPHAKAAPPVKAPTVRRAAPVPERSKAPLIGGIAVAVVAVAAAAFFALKPGKTDPVRPPPPPPPAVDPFAAALKDLADVRTYETAHAEELETLISRYEAVLPHLPPSESSRVEARLAELKLARDIRSALAAIKGDALRAFGKSNYGAAIAALEGARSRYTAREWTGGVDNEIGSYRTRAENAALEIHREADKLQGSDAIRKLEEIEAFGIASLTSDAQKRIEDIRRSMAGADQMLEADRKAWETLLSRVLPLAFNRDYDAARGEVASALGTFKTERYGDDARALNADLETIRAVADASIKGAQSIQPKEEMEFAYRRPDGTLEFVKGAVTSREGTTVVIDDSQYKAFGPDGWFAGSDALKLARRAGDVEPAAAGLFLLFEREGKSAEALLGAVPPRYLAVLNDAKRVEMELEASREKHGIAARTLFDEAERLYKEKKSGEAAHRYRALLREYAATDVVRTNQKTIKSRAAPSGPEIVLYASDVALADRHGIWNAVTIPAAAEKTALSTNDFGMEGAPVERSTDYVDLFFYASPLVDYHLWVKMILPPAKGASNKILVQFSDAVGADGRPANRIGSPDALVLQYWGGPSSKDWGWTDRDMLAASAPTPIVRFKTGGLKTMRLFLGEDGTTVDQFVLSTKQFITAGPVPSIVKKP